VREVEAPAVELEGGGPIVIVAANGSSSTLAKMCGRRRTSSYRPRPPLPPWRSAARPWYASTYGAGWTLMTLVCHVGALEEDDNKR
jgi:hypothetical protein